MDTQPINMLIIEGRFEIAITAMLLLFRLSLQWRHNDHDSVSNHQPHGCLLNRLFRRKSKKTSKLRVTGLCVGKSPGPVNYPHKGPVTRKMFPFDDVIMFWLGFDLYGLFTCATVVVWTLGDMLYSGPSINGYITPRRTESVSMNICILNWR